MSGLSEQREAEIRERDARDFDPDSAIHATMAANDRRALLAAYDERGKENERLRAQVAVAWDEGDLAATLDFRCNICTDLDDMVEPTPNPYRAALASGDGAQS